MGHWKPKKPKTKTKVPGAIMELAIKIHGSQAVAQEWLKLPKQRFGGLSPMQRLERPNGEKAVEEALGLLAKGVFEYA